MRALGPLLPLAPLALTLLAACSGAAASAEPGIASRTAIAPEERSTCEALGRVDLAVIGTDAASRWRSATGLADAARRSPADAPIFTVLADAYRTSAAAAWEEPHRADVIHWFNQRCGGTR